MSEHVSPYDLTLPFGPYQNQSLGYVWETHPSYLDRLIGNLAIPEWWREAAAYVMMGKPIPKAIIPTNIPAAPKVPNRDAVLVFYVNDEVAGVSFNHDRTSGEAFRVAVDATFDMDGQFFRVPIPKVPAAVKYFGGENKVKLDKKVRALAVKEHKRRLKLDVIRKKEDSHIEIPTKVPLYDYQKVAVEFGVHAGGRFIDADEMGLGKTPTSIGFALYKGDKTLVTTRAKVVLGFAKEIERFAGVTPCIWTGDGPQGDLNAQFHIISNALLEKFRFDLNEQKFDCATVDECTDFKNHKSGRTKSLFGKWDERKYYPGIDFGHITMLTGTPILSRPTELYTLLHILDSKRFSSPTAFKRRYGDGKIIPYQNLEELHQRTKDLIIRRLMQDVRKEMPLIQRSPLWVELSKSEMESYRKVENDLFRKWALRGRPSAAQMPMLRYALFDYKFPYIIDYIDALREAGRSALIFSIHPDHAYRIAEHYGKAARAVTGHENAKQTERAKLDLMNGVATVGSMTINAAGMGLDGLQQSMSDVLFVDRWWVPAIHSQAEFRLQRIGQAGQVRARYMTCPGTYDEDMALVLDEKQRMIDEAVDGIKRDQLANSSTFGDVLYKMCQRREEQGLNLALADETELIP